MPAAMTAEEVRNVRTQYGLSQKSFAHLLGIGEASIVRYEGGAKPSRANANLIRAARHPEFMRECIERDGDAIPAAQRDNALRVIYACVSLDSEKEGEAPTSGRKRFTNKMSEVYHYTIQQEVLNEVAAGIIAEIISAKVTTGFAGEANDVFEDLLAQVSEIKPTIVSEASADDLKLASIRGYLQCANELLKRQNSKVA